MSVVIWVQAVCKGYQQTLAWTELTRERRKVTDLSIRYTSAFYIGIEVKAGGYCSICNNLRHSPVYVGGVSVKQITKRRDAV